MAFPAEASLREIDPDAQLMLAFQAGDVSAFEKLFERWAQPLLRYLERIVRDAATAEELVQEAFLRVHRARARYVPEAKFSTWLYRIGVNVCLSHVRSKVPATEPMEDDGHIDPRSDDPAERVLRVERAARVRAAIIRLPERQRATLVLRMYHELSHQEIASILGNSVGTVKANFFHALRNLKKLLEAEPG